MDGRLKGCGQVSRRNGTTRSCNVDATSAGRRPRRPDPRFVEVGSANGTLIAFDRHTGNELWASQANVPAGHNAGPTPITVEGVPCVADVTFEEGASEVEREAALLQRPRVLKLRLHRGLPRSSGLTVRENNARP